MPRLIDANALIDDLEAAKNNGGMGEIIAATLIRYVKRQPTADAAPVDPGRWEDFCRDKMCCCSACKAEFDNTCNDIHGEWKFCPNCGAKMDGDGNG